MSRRRLLQTAVLLAVGVLILYGLLRTVHPDQVGRAIRNANPGWIAVGLGGYLAFIVIRGWRWLVILKASAPAAHERRPASRNTVSMARKISCREIFEWPRVRSVKVIGTSTIVSPERSQRVSSSTRAE